MVITGSSAATTAQINPHRVIQTGDAREQFALDLLDALWVQYRERVNYVQVYEQVIAQAGATFVNDHIAFRTFASQQPSLGIATISRVFEALGYVAAGCYQFPDKQLSSIHFQHPHPQFPKLFISELKTWELSPKSRQIIHKVLSSHRPPVSDDTLTRLYRLDQLAGDAKIRLIDELKGFFQTRPWDPPQKEDILTLNQESQFAAWVLVHGYNVNHFTALVNSHGAGPLDDIEKTVEAMRQAQVPMKQEIEGERGSKLRQTATEAVRTETQVADGNTTTNMTWTYAYFEFAERGQITDSTTGRTTRFEGFLGPQATQLFEMTRVG